MALPLSVCYGRPVRAPCGLGSSAGDGPSFPYGKAVNCKMRLLRDAELAAQCEQHRSSLLTTETRLACMSKGNTGQSPVLEINLCKREGFQFIDIIDDAKVFALTSDHASSTSTFLHNTVIDIRPDRWQRFPLCQDVLVEFLKDVSNMKTRKHFVKTCETAISSSTRICITFIDRRSSKRLRLPPYQILVDFLEGVSCR